MKAIKKSRLLLSVLMLFLLMGMLSSCKKHNPHFPTVKSTISVENVLQSKPLVESGVFKYDGATPLIMPGTSASFQFSASKGQAISFACMYGWSNDLFFAPGNPGIKLFDDAGNPVEGDVSDQIKLWDNGTRINQHPGSNVMHPGTAETTPQNIMEVNGTDAQGNSYLPASSLMKATLHYEGNSIFTLTIENTSGGTANETPFSPGVWAISYNVGGNLLNPAPLYSEGMPSAHGLTNIAEMGNTDMLYEYIMDNTGIFTPLSPVLVVVYRGTHNPIFMTGEKDAGHGLSNLAQTGDASVLAGYLNGVPGVKKVYVLPASGTTVLLPRIGDQTGSKVSQELNLAQGDKIAIATMYGFSNDWFFASTGEIEATHSSDISLRMGLFDDGTAVSQFPGAGVNQAAAGGAPVTESNPIVEVPNPNAFNTLPPINEIIKVTLQ
jgi:hypothetical protein